MPLSQTTQESLEDQLRMDTQRNLACSKSKSPTQGPAETTEQVLTARRILKGFVVKIFLLFILMLKELSEHVCKYEGDSS